MNCIGIIGAMETEVARLKEMMEDVTVVTKASMEFYQGTLKGKKDSGSPFRDWQGECRNLCADPGRCFSGRCPDQYRYCRKLE